LVEKIKEVQNVVFQNGKMERELILDVSTLSED